MTCPPTGGAPGAPAVGVDITASSRLPATRRHQTCSTGEVFPWIFPRLFPLFRVSFPVSTVFLAGRGGAFFASFSRCTCLWAESIRRPRTATSSPPLPAPCRHIRFLPAFPSPQISPEPFVKIPPDRHQRGHTLPVTRTAQGDASYLTFGLEK